MIDTFTNVLSGAYGEGISKQRPWTILHVCGKIGGEVKIKLICHTLAVLGDQCEPVSTKMAARENTWRTPGDFLNF